MYLKKLFKLKPLNYSLTDYEYAKIKYFQIICKEMFDTQLKNFLKKIK